MMKKVLIMLCVALAMSCAGEKSLIDRTDKPLSVRMAESEMVRVPDAYMLDGGLKWTYTTGLELLAFTDVYERYGNEEFLDYAMSYPDTMIYADGSIHSYKLTNYNVDLICPGRLLLKAYDLTGEERYAHAIDTLWAQIGSQPRVKEGGFWHKAIYPNQMWLDGLYMCQPFYAAYAGRNTDDPAPYYEDIMRQFLLAAEHTYDPATGLYRHAWDSSHEMFWCEPETGRSPHAWGRALGWYVMGIVEVLDLVPEDVEGRDELIAVLRGIYDVLPRYANPETGMWYQVLDSPEREGNYQEASASAMFTYGMLKAVRMGYLDKDLERSAEELYEKFVERFIRENEDGTISIIDCCSVSGLGGANRRDGTFEYYISEPIRDNDPKAVGPFIWASLEYEALNR